MALDRNTMRKYVTTDTSLNSGEPGKKTIKITSWGENKISFELDHKIKHKLNAHNPFIKNDKYYQQDYGGAWFSTNCTRVKER
tara:strand:- start:188 stop:436 length:249 start_codon:yes stop_codon:yes gene_type:complete